MVTSCYRLVKNLFWFVDFAFNSSFWLVRNGGVYLVGMDTVLGCFIMAKGNKKCK